jgi:hypothetical protein
VKNNTFVGVGLTLDAVRVDNADWTTIEGNNYNLTVGSFAVNATAGNGTSVGTSRAAQGGGGGTQLNLAVL